MQRKADNRLAVDRRSQENGPPDGWRERRKSVERRRPEVSEILFSEWLLQRRSYVSKKTPDI